MSSVAGVGTMTGVALGEAPASNETRNAGGASLLPDPQTQLALSGDPGAMVAALVVEAAKSQKDLSRQIQETNAQIQDREEAAQVATMREKASQMREFAWGAGAAGIAAGGLSMGAACVPSSGSAVASPLALKLDAGSKLMAAGGSLISQEGAASAAFKDADIATHEHAASDASRTVGQAYDDERDAKKLLDTALDFYREYSSARDQAMVATTHRG